MFNGYSCTDTNDRHFPDQNINSPLLSIRDGLALSVCSSFNISSILLFLDCSSSSLPTSWSLLISSVLVRAIGAENSSWNTKINFIYHLRTLPQDCKYICQDTIMYLNSWYTGFDAMTCKKRVGPEKKIRKPNIMIITNVSIFNHLLYSRSTLYIFSFQPKDPLLTDNDN